MSSSMPYSGDQSHYSGSFSVDHEEGKGSCLAIKMPGRRNRKKEGEQQRSLLREAESSSLRAWSTPTTVKSEKDDLSGIFPEDPFMGGDKQETSPKSVAVTADALLKPSTTPGRRRRSPVYEGEQEPRGFRGQEAKVPDTRSSRSITPDGPTMRSFASQNTPEGPTMRSFTARDTPSDESMQFVSPQESAPRQRDNPLQNAKDEKPNKEVISRTSFLDLMPVAETSIPEGVEEDSSDDDYSFEDEQPAMRDFFSSSSKANALAKMRSPHTVRDPRKYRQPHFQEATRAVSPPTMTPRMSKAMEEKLQKSQKSMERKGSWYHHSSNSERSQSQRSSNVTSESTRDLQEMMPDLIPTPKSNVSQRKKTKDMNAVQQVEGMNAAAMEHVENGEYDMALAAFEQVLAVYIEIYGELHPLVASTYHNLGMVHSKRAALLLDGTFHQSHCRQQSLECFQAAARTGRDSLGPNHPNVAVSLVRIGFLLLQARQYQNAFTTFKEALRIRMAHYGAKPASLVANLYNNLGVCKMHLGQYKEGSSHLKIALDIQREVLRAKRKEEDATRGELRNCLLEVGDTLCNLGGLYLEWIRQQGPDAGHAAEAEVCFAEALEIRTTVLGPSHALVHQVRTLHKMALSTPVPAPSPELNVDRAKAPLVKDPAANRPPRVKSRKNGVSFESGELNRGFVDSSMLSESTQERKGTREPERRHISTHPMSEIRVDSDDAPPTRESVAITNSSERDMSNFNFGKTKIRVPPHRVPRTSEPMEKSHDTRDQWDSSAFIQTSMLANCGSEASDASPISLFKGLRDLNSGEGGALLSQINDVEECCLIGDIGGDSDRATSLLLSMLEREESFLGDKSRILSPHEITVVRSFEGGFDMPGPQKSRRTTSRSRAMAEGGRATGNGHVERVVKPYNDSPTVKLNDESAIYTVRSFGASDGGTSVDSHSLTSEDEHGLAPLGEGWITSKGSTAGHALTKSILDNPEDHLGTIYEAAGRYLKRNQCREALHLFQTILDCQRRLHGELHADVGSAWHNVGIALLRAGRQDQALKAFEKAVRVRKGSLGKDHPEVAVSLVKVGIAQLLLRDFESALLSFRDALAVRRHALGALHPSTARVYNNIGCVHMEFNELHDARRAFEAALDIQRNALYNEPTNGPLIFGTATTLCNLGYLFTNRDMPERAALFLKEAVGLQEQILGPNHRTVLSTMGNFADACAKSGQEAVALRNYGEILDRYKATLNREEEGTKRTGTEAILLFKMSRVHRLLNDHEAELSKLEMALQAIRSSDDRFMTDKERDESDRLAVLISADIHRVDAELGKDNLDWL